MFSFFRGCSIDIDAIVFRGSFSNAYPLLSSEMVVVAASVQLRQDTHTLLQGRMDKFMISPYKYGIHAIAS